MKGHRFFIKSRLIASQLHEPWAQTKTIEVNGKLSVDATGGWMRAHPGCAGKVRGVPGTDWIAQAFRSPEPTAKKQRTAGTKLKAFIPLKIKDIYDGS